MPLRLGQEGVVVEHGHVWAPRHGPHHRRCHAGESAAGTLDGAPPGSYYQSKVFTLNARAVRLFAERATLCSSPKPRRSCRLRGVNLRYLRGISSCQPPDLPIYCTPTGVLSSAEAGDRVCAGGKGVARALIDFQNEF
jgi:hypothetical protein